MKKSSLVNYFNTFAESSKILTHNINRSVELVQSFKRIAVDQNSEMKMKFNMFDYINTILLSLKHEYKRKNIVFSVNCENDLIINSIPGAFSHIFTNLIMNSIIHGFKHMENGKIDINVVSMDSELIIQYSDNGSGIDKIDITKIFEPFFTTNRGNGGSGLGLNVVYLVVNQQLNGNITVESDPYISTKFTIKIPTEIIV